MESNFVHSTTVIPGNYDQKKRPDFILILCILGFVGVGVGVIYYSFVLYFSYKFYEVMQSVSTISQQLSQSPNSSPPILPNTDYSGTLFWMVVSNGGAIISQLISLVGLILIFKLKKAGLVIYIASELLALGLLIFATTQYSSFGAVSTGFWGSGMVVIGITAVFDFAFIIMHIINYKHLD